MNKEKCFKVNRRISFGEYMSELPEDDLSIFETALYIQQWADLLGTTYQDISGLSIAPKQYSSLEACIDITVKKHYNKILKRPDIMAKILGEKHEHRTK